MATSTLGSKKPSNISRTKDAALGHCLLLRLGGCRFTIVLMLYAGSGLPQGPFSENNLFPLKVGFRWVLVNGLKWVQKWVKSGFWGAKVGQNAPKPTFSPTLNPFRQIHENPLFTQFKGGGNCFPKRALRQSRPSITHAFSLKSGGDSRCRADDVFLEETGAKPLSLSMIAWRFLCQAVRLKLPWVKTFIPATEPRDPRRVSEGFLKRSLKGSRKGSLKGFGRVQPRTLQNPFKTPSKRLQNAFKIKLFGWDIPGFCRDIPESPEKFEKNEFVFNFWPLYIPFFLSLRTYSL